MTALEQEPSTRSRDQAVILAREPVAEDGLFDRADEIFVGRISPAHFGIEHDKTSAHFGWRTAAQHRTRSEVAQERIGRLNVGIVGDMREHLARGDRVLVSMETRTI